MTATYLIPLLLVCDAIPPYNLTYYSYNCDHLIRLACLGGYIANHTAI